MSPTALLTAFASHSYPFYHTPLDTLDQLGPADYEYATEMTRGVVGYLATQAGLEPVRLRPDFNGDWKVDIDDLTMLIEHWGQADPAFDIAPPPLGDGLVDAKDLEVLMSYWRQEVNDPRLAASWRLDETEGIVAVDKIGENDGTLHGGPLWQSEGGRTGGALLLDGVDDYIGTAFVLDPPGEPFSVFAWVKGGAAGQVILSQVGGANWLRAAPVSGTLRTELNEPGRNAMNHLQSSVVTTDGAWHQVGLVWDGTDRALYVDDVEVARGTLTRLPNVSSGLYLGAGSTLTPGTFWSGLIDDVRIYNRAVQP